MKYDSAPDTIEHICAVAYRLGQFSYQLQLRANNHDASKLESPEKEFFDEFTPKLKELSYGSDEYKAALTALKPALDHHYRVNSHHPENEEFSKEEWRPIHDAEGYEVSNLGRVRSLDRVVDREGPTGNLSRKSQEMTANLTAKGYKRIQLSVNAKPSNRLVHRLVAEAFLGPKPSDDHQINHKDGNKQNNRAWNLEWVTPSENLQHSYDLGIRPKQLKYIVVCTLPDGEELVTRGVTRMAKELVARGYTEARESSILAAIDQDQRTHLGLSFVSHPIQDPSEYSGIDDMTLVDLVEMLCDWRAATERHADGSMQRSLQINQQRYAISDQLQAILTNTATEFGWINTHHLPDCDTNDINPEGIKKPCNCQPYLNNP